MPDAGEDEADDGKRFPSDLSRSTAIKRTPDGFTYLDPTQFRDYFAGSGVRNSRSKLVAAASFPDIFGEEVEIFSPKFCRESS